MGILYRSTCPYTLEQNGLIERKHRQIVETDLALLAQPSLPLKFWSDAFSTTVYLINRLLTKVLNSKALWKCYMVLNLIIKA